MDQPEIHPVYKVVDAELIHGNVLITFSDGRLAIYSHTLLRAVISQADEIIAVDPDPEWR